MANTGKISRKELLSQDDAFTHTGFDVADWLEAHWRTVVKVSAGLLVVVAAIAAFTTWRGRQADAAKQLVADGLALYAPDPDVKKGAAPNYAGALAAFEKAAGSSGGSPIGEVARFYKASCLVKLGRLPEAAPILESLRTDSDRALADNAAAVLASAQEGAGELDKAAALYQGLADAKDGQFPPDEALLRVGKIRKRQGRADDARKAFEAIVTRYPQGTASSEARSLMGIAGSAQ